MSMKRSSINRRTFIAGATTGLTAAGLGATVSRGQAPEDRLPIRAVVLEFEDRWTEKSTGLALLLKAAGADVVDLNLDRSPLQQLSAPHLISFGSFTNNGAEYPEYVRRFASELQQFVATGGVVLEMTQSDQLGSTIDYLPAGMLAKRGNLDLSMVRAMDSAHPLASGWFPKGVEQLGSDYFHRENTNWESFDEWEGLQVVLASEADGRRPCLLEGAYGKGRFLISSLWLDKCYRPDGSPTYGEAAVEVSQRFISSVVDYVWMVVQGTAPSVEPTPMPTILATGPMVGHVDTSMARIWFRPADDKRCFVKWVCTVKADNEVIYIATKTPDADHDFTLLFDIQGLRPDMEYTYQIAPHTVDSTSPIVYGPHKFTTGPSDDSPSKLVLGLGSCAPSDPNYVWTRIVEEGCEGFVFLGDTPYVDSSDLGVAREKHRTFLSQPEIARMIANMPCWGTWDDHDFGRNDGHGDFPGKHVCRTAFTEYRANREFGHSTDGQLQTDPSGNGRGIYTSFRRGPLEVFLIDPRWFSRTEASWADENQPTCIGRVQWEWLKRGLQNSTATFKALTTGMIWDDKTNSEKDDWYTYRYEREAIYNFIRDESISGCFLISGDIHVSRALNYGPRIGYDLWEFIISPLHNRTIAELDIPHPNLVHHAVEPYVFVRMEVDDTVSPAQLKAEWINRDGRRIFEVSLDSNQLKSDA